MSKPHLLDLFCGAGGATKGYQDAGFRVTGVDIKPQARYCGETFIQADALEYVAAHGQEYDLIHASPPCQAYTVANNIHGRTDHPRLIAPLREMLLQLQVPYVLENVVRAPLRFPIQICGLALGIRVKRHRLFESSRLLFGTDCGDHTADYAIVFGGVAKGRGHTIGKTAKGGSRIRRPSISHADAQKAMGIDWMSREELSQAIPPAYTKWIGLQLLRGVT
jgi:DNA (cytosine-5)-methyltransferase 1